MLDDYFVYDDKNILIKAKTKDFITIYQTENNNIVDNMSFINDNDFMSVNYKKMSKKTINKIGYALISLIDSFTSETVVDEIAFALESEGKSVKDMKKEIKEIAKDFNFEKELETSPILLSTSSKAKLSIVRSIVTKPKVFIIDNILSLLDKDDYEIVTNYLKYYATNGNIILNFTTNIEESLLGNRIIVLSKDKILIEGETLSVLNEEKIMKRLGLSLPFIVLLNRYLKDYDLINNYYLDNESLVGELWK